MSEANNTTTTTTTTNKAPGKLGARTAMFEPIAQQQQQNNNSNNDKPRVITTGKLSDKLSMFNTVPGRSTSNENKHSNNNNDKTTSTINNSNNNNNNIETQQQQPAAARKIGRLNMDLSALNATLAQGPKLFSPKNTPTATTPKASDVNTITNETNSATDIPQHSREMSSDTISIISDNNNNNYVPAYPVTPSDSVDTYNQTNNTVNPKQQTNDNTTQSHPTDSTTTSTTPQQQQQPVKLSQPTISRARVQRKPQQRTVMPTTINTFNVPAIAVTNNVTLAPVTVVDNNDNNEQHNDNTVKDVVNNVVDQIIQQDVQRDKNTYNNTQPGITAEQTTTSTIQPTVTQHHTRSDTLDEIDSVLDSTPGLDRSSVDLTSNVHAKQPTYIESQPTVIKDSNNNTNTDSTVNNKLNHRLRLESLLAAQHHKRNSSTFSSVSDTTHTNSNIRVPPSIPVTILSQSQSVETTSTSDRIEIIQPYYNNTNADNNTVQDSTTQPQTVAANIDTTSDAQLDNLQQPTSYDTHVVLTKQQTVTTPTTIRPPPIPTVMSTPHHNTTNSTTSINDVYDINDNAHAATGQQQLSTTPSKPTQPPQLPLQYQQHQPASHPSTTSNTQIQSVTQPPDTDNNSTTYNESRLVQHYVDVLRTGLIVSIHQQKHKHTHQYSLFVTSTGFLQCSDVKTGRDSIFVCYITHIYSIERGLTHDWPHIKKIKDTVNENVCVRIINNESQSLYIEFPFVEVCNDFIDALQYIRSNPDKLLQNVI